MLIYRMFYTLLCLLLPDELYFCQTPMGVLAAMDMPDRLVGKQPSQEACFSEDLKC